MLFGNVFEFKANKIKQEINSILIYLNYNTIKPSNWEGLRQEHG